MTSPTAINQSIRTVLERLERNGGSGVVAHATAKALARRGLVTLATVRQSQHTPWQPSEMRATLTAKGRAALDQDRPVSAPGTLFPRTTTL